MYTVISFDKNQNSWMTAFDLFEEGKVLGHIQEVTIRRLNHRISSKKRILALKDSFEHAGDIVSFVSLDTERILPYINPKVRVISTGEKWYLLKEWIKKRYPALNVKTNEHQYITSVSFEHEPK